MTSLLNPPRTDATDAASRRPLAMVTSLGGATAAGSTLLVCLAVGVVGWFASDAGAHGTPRDGLRTGALAWLMGHGSGISIHGVGVTVMPWGITLICAWVTWRLALRVGESVSGHGPDADAIADGERDVTVPVAVGLFAAGYVVVAVLTGVLAATATTTPSLGHVLLWSLLLSALVGGPAIAIGSGRAAIWTAMLPISVRATVSTAARILLGFLVVSALTVLVSLVLHFGAAANVLSRMHLDAGDALMFLLVNAVLLPNAMVFGGSYLLGPGFAVGTATLVSPTVVSIGPLPSFPLLAALPDNGPAPWWTIMLMGLPFLAAAAGATYAHRRQPTTRWDEGALRGCVGGVLAGVVFAVLAALAGGVVGPGRMREVGPFAFDVLVHAITVFGIGGLLGAVFMVWRERRVQPVTR
jgi:hypothetical protein